ncbi:MAG: DUF423 domain-containing protein [Saprospirales bacterium]|nr:DUF423 domain-containing protein [Saprospirales bacterium]
MHRPFFIWASFFALVAVAFGALGAHALKEVLSPGSLATFETGVRYQFYHALALFITSFAYAQRPETLFRWAGRLFIAGVFCFSGSLYLLSTRELLGIGHWTWLGPITPLGGLLFLSGWWLLAWGAWRNGNNKG